LGAKKCFASFFPKFLSNVNDEEKENKFWDVEAQIAQIFGTIPDPETQLGGPTFPQPSKLFFGIAGEGWKHKF